MTQRYFILLFLCFSLLGTACTPGEKVRPQVATKADQVSLMLAEAADRASTALETLAAVEQRRSPDISVGPILNAPEELMRAVTISWTGPVEPVTRMLADRASYVFNTIGSPPPVPIVVNVDVENKPVVDVLRSIGLQMGVRADVRVDAARRLIEIQYAPSTGVGQ